MKAKRILLSTLLTLSLWLTGCGVKIVNMTPDTAMASPTGTYTLKAQAQVKKKTVVPSSLEAFVVINGEQRPMQADANGGFKYDYTAAQDELLTRFYYVLNYTIQKEGDAPISEQIISDLYQLQLQKPIVLQLDKQRAATGSRVNIFGQQFTSADIVGVDGIAAQTQFISPTQLQFIVPQAKPGFGYTVEVRNSTRSQIAGYLRIDPASPLRVLPTSLTLKSGQRQALAFALDYPAPYGGLYINVTTDISESIIMPEVLIPEGARTVSATIEGAKIGSGHLFINAKNLPELIIPVTIQP